MKLKFLTKKGAAVALSVMLAVGSFSASAAALMESENFAVEATGGSSQGGSDQGGSNQGGSDQGGSNQGGSNQNPGSSDQDKDDDSTAPGSSNQNPGSSNQKPGSSDQDKDDDPTTPGSSNQNPGSSDQEDNDNDPTVPGDSDNTTNQDKTVAVTSIKLSETSAVIVKGQTKTLTATVAPTNATNKTVTWSSSNEAVAKVDAKGVVTAIKAGDAVITAKTANGKTASCNVSVAEVKLNATSIPLQKGKSTKALVVKSKYPANDAVASWSSSNSKIVKVTNKGKITAKKIGTATVTVTMKSGATASCKVKVQKKKVVLKKLTLSSKKLTINKGKKATLIVTRKPITATEKLKWYTSNKKVATVSKKGVVKAKKVGKAKITVKSSNGKKATCTVTVKKAKK